MLQDFVASLCSIFPTENQVNFIAQLYTVDFKPCINSCQLHTKKYHTVAVDDTDTLVTTLAK
jgi:hypothetical protein